MSVPYLRDNRKRDTRMNSLPHRSAGKRRPALPNLDFSEGNLAQWNGRGLLPDTRDREGTEPGVSAVCSSDVGSQGQESASPSHLRRPLPALERST